MPQSRQDVTVPRYIPQAISRTILVDGIRTHYLEYGEGPPVVLLHDGSYGSSAELSWSMTSGWSGPVSRRRSSREPGRPSRHPGSNRHSSPNAPKWDSQTRSPTNASTSP